MLNSLLHNNIHTLLLVLYLFRVYEPCVRQEISEILLVTLVEQMRINLQDTVQYLSYNIN